MFWTLHICIQLLNIYIHVVIYTESFVLLNSARYYGSWSYTDTYYYACSTSSSSLTGGCTRYSVSSSVCNSDDQVGLWCMTQPQAGKYMYILNTFTKQCTAFCVYVFKLGWCTKIVLSYTGCPNGAVRLVGGASSNKGKLEYCHYGAWSSFCTSFHDEEATVACKQLGFSGSPSKNIPV